MNKSIIMSGRAGEHLFSMLLELPVQLKISILCLKKENTNVNIS